VEHDEQGGEEAVPPDALAHEAVCIDRCMARRIIAM
jgi:hypothetical protein